MLVGYTTHYSTMAWTILCVNRMLLSHWHSTSSLLLNLRGQGTPPQMKTLYQDVSAIVQCCMLYLIIFLISTPSIYTGNWPCRCCAIYSISSWKLGDPGLSHFTAALNLCVLISTYTIQTVVWEEENNFKLIDLFRKIHFYSFFNQFYDFLHAYYNA